MRKDFGVGLIFLVAVLGFAFLVSRVNSTRSGMGKTHAYYALVPDSTGLLEGSGIRLAGIVVGRMSRKSLQANQARLDLEIDVRVILHSDAKITLRTLGYLGDRYVDLNPGSEGKPTLPEGAMIPATQAATLENLMEEGADFLGSWSSVAKTLNALLGGR